MIINCFYDECKEYADIVYIPDEIEDISEVHEKFFEWMFDERADHDYLVISSSGKKYYKYGTKAFLDWLNGNLLGNCHEKAYMITENATVWNEQYRSLFF